MTVTTTPAATANSLGSTGSEAAPTAGQAPEDQLVEEDLLVEDVSIDGMCGVY